MTILAFKEHLRTILLSCIGNTAYTPYELAMMEVAAIKYQRLVEAVNGTGVTVWVYEVKDGKATGLKIPVYQKIDVTAIVPGHNSLAIHTDSYETTKTILARWKEDKLIPDFYGNGWGTVFFIPYDTLDEPDDSDLLSNPESIKAVGVYKIMNNRKLTHKSPYKHMGK